MTNGISILPHTQPVYGEDAVSAMSERVVGALGPAVVSHSITFGELTLVIQASDIVYALTYLRDDPTCAFRCFIDICGADYPAREKRFDVVYHLLSPRQNFRIRVKVMTSEDVPVPSLTPSCMPSPVNFAT